MNAVVELGNIFLVLTSRPEISAQCEKRMKTHELFKRIKCVTLDDGEFSLRVSEKRKIMEKYFGRKKRLSEEDIKEIAEMKTSLGFPQCCAFFASHKLPASRAVSFFRNPQVCIREILDCLKESEPLSYFVLLLVMIQKGFLEHKLLKSRKDTNFSDVVADLSTFCDIPGPPGYGQIASKAATLSGVYLLSTQNGFEFQHQSIYDAVFLDLAGEDPEICIKICPSQMLVELVRTENKETEDEGVVIYLKKEYFETLADRITNILLSEDGVEILNHPSLQDGHFRTYLETKLERSVCEDIGTREVSAASITYYPDISNMLGPHVVFTYRFLLSHVLLKQGALAKYILLQSSNIPNAVLKEFIICAIYQSHNDVINLLMDRGVVPDVTCLKALSASQSIDEATSSRLLDLISSALERFQEREDVLFLATLNGNVELVKRIIDSSGDGSHELCSHTLSALFKEMANNPEYNNAEWMQGRRQILEEILHLLLTHIPEMNEIAHLLYKCAGHAYPVAMKILIDKCTSHNVDIYNLKECLQLACKAGGGECVRIILEHLTMTEGTYNIIADCIGLSAQSATDSCQKIQLLMNFIDTFCEHTGNVPSHTQILNRIYGVFTPLTRACEHGNLDTLKMLIRKGADVNLEDGRGSTPLHTAVGLDNSACVTALLEAGALVNKRIPGSQPVIFGTNRLDIVQKLVAANCDINATDEDGRSALHTAAGFNNIDVFKFLCTKGCNVDHKDEYGLTPYQVAAEYGDLDMLRYLHKMHAKPTVDVDGLSVLHYACCSVNEAMEKVQFLVDTVKVPIDTRDEDGRTALYPAVQTAGLEVVEFLVERGLSIKDRDKDGNTYLHAVFQRYEKSAHEDLVTFLFKVNLDPDLYNTRDGRTPLHLALDSGLWYFFEDHLVTLIDRTSNINHKDSEGRTPLHMAAYRDVSWVVKRLLDKGANKDLKDSDGYKAIDLVPEHGSDETKALLCPPELPTPEIVYSRQGASSKD